MTASARGRAIDAYVEVTWGADKPIMPEEVWLRGVVESEVDAVAAALGITFDEDGEIDRSIVVVEGDTHHFPMGMPDGRYYLIPVEFADG